MMATGKSKEKNNESRLEAQDVIQLNKQSFLLNYENLTEGCDI